MRPPDFRGALFFVSKNLQLAFGYSPLGLKFLMVVWRSPTLELSFFDAGQL